MSGPADMPRRLKRLQEAYGREIELIDDDGGGTETFRLLAEFELGGAVYAALQTPAMRQDDEIAFFRVEERDDGFELADIDDEDEWEAAAEGYDELLFEEQSSGGRGE